MNGVKGLDILGDESHKFGHYRLHSCRVASSVGGAHQDAVKPLVVGADPEPLTSGPLGIVRIAPEETPLGKASRQIDDHGFDMCADTFEQDPVGGSEPVEGTAPDQFESPVPSSWIIRLGKGDEASPIRTDACPERKSTVGTR